MVKICQEIINFLGFFPRKKIYYTEKKSAQIFEKFTPKIKICPLTESNHLQYCQLHFGCTIKNYQDQLNLQFL